MHGEKPGFYIEWLEKAHIKPHLNIGKTLIFLKFQKVNPTGGWNVQNAVLSKNFNNSTL